MAYSTYDRWGGYERNPPVERLREILQQLDIEIEDREHTDVSLRHRETGWYLSAFLSGRLMWAWDADADEDASDPIEYGGDRYIERRVATESPGVVAQAGGGRHRGG
jgi:hypothetical protein